MRSSIMTLGRMGLLAWNIARVTFNGNVSLPGFLEHLYKVIIRCLLPVMAVLLPFGMVMSLQGLDIFALYGTQRMLSSFVAAAIIRELSPVMACVLVAAQGGASIAAELGAMRIKEEIDATEVMAVDSVAHHVAPRFLALVVACPLLDMLGCVSGIAGGYLTAVLMNGEPSGTFVAEMWVMTTWYDLLATVLKSLVFGGIIGLVSSYLGYNARGGAAGVGRAVNDSVVYSVLAFITANYLLTSAIYGGIT